MENTSGGLKPERGVTVNIVVHNPDHMKYMNKIGIYMMYYCKDCPYNSEALLDVTSHVSENHIEEEEEAVSVTRATTPSSKHDSTDSQTSSTPNTSQAQLKTLSEISQVSIATESEVISSDNTKIVLAGKEETSEEGAVSSRGDLSSSKVKTAGISPKNGRGWKRRRSNADVEDDGVKAGTSGVDVDEADTSLVPRDFFCPKCPYTVIYSAVELEQHRLCHVDGASHDKPELMCYVCRPKRGRKLEGTDRGQGEGQGRVWFHLKQHLHQRHGIDFQISCKLCDVLLKSHLEFKSHKATHTVSCDLCRFSSVTESDVITHRKCHVDNSARMFRCYQCGYQCSREGGKWSLMHAHLVARHPGSITPLYQCQQCQKGFQSLRQHRLHVPRCLKAPLCTCPVCGVKVHPNLYPAHAKSHEGDEPEAAAPKPMGPVFVEIVSKPDTGQGAEENTAVTVINIPSIREAGRGKGDKVSMATAVIGDKDSMATAVTGDKDSMATAVIADAEAYICELHDKTYITKEAFTAHLTEEHQDIAIEENIDVDPEDQEMEAAAGGGPGEEAPGGLGEEAPGRLGEEAPGGPWEEAPGRLGEEAPGRLGEEAPGGLGEEAPGRLGEEAPGRLGEEAPGRLGGPDHVDPPRKYSRKRAIVPSEEQKCSVCYKKFSTEERLMKHIARVHEKQAASVPCEICGKQFKNRVRVRNHVREVHEGVKRKKREGKKTEKPVTYHICESCGYTTPSSLRLQNHQLSVHQGILRYQCDKCDYKTSEKSDLYRHKWRHRGTKKHNCDYCAYKTNTRWLMVNHVYKRHGIQLPKQSKDTMGCIWSVKWQNKLRRMSGKKEPLPGTSQEGALPVPVEKEVGPETIQEEFIHHVGVEELIEDGSVLYDPETVSEVIVTPGSVYTQDTMEITEATQAALLLLSLPPNQTTSDHSI